MAGVIGSMKKQRGVTRYAKKAKHLIGLPVNSGAPIVIGDAPGELVFADTSTAQEWALPKSAVTDVGFIHANDLKKIAKDLEGLVSSAEILAEALDLVNSIVSFDFSNIVTNLLRGMARGANNFCLIVSYRHDGANHLILLQLDPDYAQRCIRMMRKSLSASTAQFAKPLPTLADADAQVNILLSNGAAGAILRQDMVERSGAQKTCAACGKKIPFLAKYCPL